MRRGRGPVRGHLLTSWGRVAEDKKASSLLREAMEAVAASDDQFTFGVDVHADSVSGSWDSSLVRGPAWLRRLGCQPPRPRTPLAQEHSLDELLRTIDARVTHFTELRVRGVARGAEAACKPRPTHARFSRAQKRLQEREVRRSEYTMEAQNLENMHMRNMPVEATSKVGRATATPTAALRR